MTFALYRCRFPNRDGTFTERRYYTDGYGIHFEGDDLPVAPEAPGI